MKKLAAGEPIVAVPAVVEEIPVQTPAIAVEVQVRNAQVAIRIAQKYAMRRQSHHPLSTLRVESNSETLSP